MAAAGQAMRHPRQGFSEDSEIEDTSEMRHHRGEGTHLIFACLPVDARPSHLRFPYFVCLCVWRDFARGVPCCGYVVISTSSPRPMWWPSPQEDRAA